MRRCSITFQYLALSAITHSQTFILKKKASNLFSVASDTHPYIGDRHRLSENELWAQSYSPRTYSPPDIFPPDIFLSGHIPPRIFFPPNIFLPSIQQVTPDLTVVITDFEKSAINAVQAASPRSAYQNEGLLLPSYPEYLAESTRFWSCAEI